MKICVRQRLVKKTQFQLVALICSLGAAMLVPAMLRAEPSLTARFVQSQGTQLVIEINAGPNPPATAILIQHLPPGVFILAAQPEPKHFSENRNKAKWLFRSLPPGISTVRMTLDRAVTANEISAEVRFKPQPEGNMVTIQVGK